MTARLFLAGVLLVATAMQVGLTRRQGLWSDEVFSLAMATGHSLEHPAAVADPARGDFVETPAPVSGSDLRRYSEFGNPAAGPGAVLRAVYVSDTSPPLYYLLLYGWCRVFGTSDFALRSLSIVFFLGCAPWLVAIGTATGDRRTGWIAATLFAVSPMVVYYSAEGRMYSLLWFCVLALMAATLRLHERADARVAQIGWCAASAAGLLVHYYFVFPWAAAVTFLAWRPGADRRALLALRVFVTLLIVLPWYLRLPENLAQWRITQDWVHWRPAGYDRLIVLRNLLVQYFSGKGHSLWPDHRWAQLGALLVFAAAAAAARWGRGPAPRRWPVVLLGLWFLAAIIGPLAADLMRGSYIAEYPRYASAAVPAACLLGGVVLARLGPVAGFAGLTLVVLAWTPSLLTIGRTRARCAQPIREVGRHISATARVDDLVLVHSIPSGAIALARYAQTRAGFASWTEQLGQRRVPESLNRLLAGRKRVVLVKVHTVGAPAPEEDWLRAHARLVREKPFGEIRVAEFLPATGSAF